MYVAELWRYPVKSMAGERLDNVRVHLDGLQGDRVVHVELEGGRVITARTRPRLLGLKGTLGPDGEPLVDGLPWTDPAVARAVVEAAGTGARLIRWDGVERFDVLPLLVATDGAIATFGRDGRRFRPNIVIGGVEGLAERSWEGRVLRAGEIEIDLADLRGRCVMTTYDPDTQEQDPEVLREIARDYGGMFALNAGVRRSGVLRLGDPVELA